MKRTIKIVYISYFLAYVLTTLTILISLLNTSLDDSNFVRFTLDYIIFLIISGIFVTYDYKIKFFNKYFIAFYLTYLVAIPVLFISNSQVLVIISIVVFILLSLIKTYQIINKTIIESNVRSILEYNKLFFITLVLGIAINLTASSLMFTSLLLFTLIVFSEALVFVKLRKLINNYDYIFLAELVITALIFILSYQGSLNLSLGDNSFNVLTNALYPVGSLLLTVVLTYHNKIRLNQIFKEISTE